MVLFYFKRFSVVVVLLNIAFFLSCNTLNSGRIDLDDTASIAAIKERGKLVAVTDYCGISFFVHRGHPMGFQFELLSDLARTIGVPLEIIPVKSIDEAYALLADGECDIVAMNLVPSKALENKFSYTVAHSKVTLGLVSLFSDSTSTGAISQGNNIMLNKHVHMAGRGIDVIDGGGKAADALVEMVAMGDIDQAIVEYSEAKVGALRFPQVKVVPLSKLTEESSWAVNSKSKKLLMEVNTWLTRFKSTASYGYILSKYKNSDDIYLRYADAFMTPGRNSISKYDQFMKQYSDPKGWDWKLVASIAYQESRFDANVVSQRGAYGLMQIMPITAEHFGYSDITSPQKNIKVGVMLLNHLREYFTKCGIEDEEAIKFVLGAYNSGLGHIEDARRLAEKYHSDPNSWEQVSFFLRKKSQPKYYRDPIVKCGKFSGNETSKFVIEVLERYGYYSSLTEI